MHANVEQGWPVPSDWGHGAVEPAESGDAAWLCRGLDMSSEYRFLFEPPRFLVDLPLEELDASGMPVLRKDPVTGQLTTIEVEGRAELKDSLLGMYRAFVRDLLVELRFWGFTLLDYFLVEQAASMYVTMVLRDALPGYGPTLVKSGRQIHAVPPKNPYRTWDSPGERRQYQSTWLQIMSTLHRDIHGRCTSNPEEPPNWDHLSEGKK